MSTKSNDEMSSEIMWENACEILKQPLDGSDVSSGEARVQVSRARNALSDVIQFIESVAVSDSKFVIRDVKEMLTKYRGAASDGSIAIDMSGKKSPQRGGWTAARSMISTSRWRDKNKSTAGNTAVGQGQGSIEMAETKKAGGHKHEDFKLPVELEEFKPLGEIGEIEKQCKILTVCQKDFVSEFQKSAPDSKKLATLKTRLKAYVTDLKGKMLTGIQGYIFEENVNEKLVGVVDAGNKHFLDVYSSVFHLIENTESADIMNYTQSYKKAKEVIVSNSKPVQTSGDPVELLCHGLATAPKYARVISDLVTSLENAGVIRKGDVVFSAAPVKKLQRVVEKSMLKSAVPGDASGTLDIVRGMAICTNMTTVKTFLDALTDLHHRKRIRRVRIKDRFNSASDGGWRDCMDNFIVAGDENQHVCELQIVHKQMIFARKGLPGHVVYGKVRNASELSLLYNGGRDGYTFNELFWKGKQQAALAMLFIKCNGHQWRAEQKKGWCTTPDLTQWAGLDVDNNGNVVSLDISRRKLDGKEGLRNEMLTPLRELKRIDLRESSRHIRTKNSDDYESFGDEDLTVISNSCPRLQVAELDFCARITDNGLSILSSGCPDLRRVELRECDLVTDAGIAILVKNCLKLERLNFKECDKLTDKGLELLSSLPKLKELNIQDCDLVTNQGVRHLAGLRLIALNYCSEINDSGIASIAKGSPDLEDISMTELEITDSGVRDLCEHCPKLKSIGLYQCHRITDGALAAVAKKCPSLEVLDVQYCPKVSDSGIKNVAVGCPELRVLRIRNCEKITDSALSILVSSCKKLEQVDCFGCNAITDRGIAKARSVLSGIDFDR